MVMEPEVANNLIFEDMYFKWSLFDPIVGSDAGEVDDLYVGSVEPADRMAG